MTSLKDFEEFKECYENQKELRDNTKKVFLRNWQVQAYNKFLNENKKGIIVAGTGTGKTHLGLKLISDIRNDEYIINKKVLVVVPTIALQEQWCDFIKNDLGYNTKKIGGNEREKNDDDDYDSLVMEEKNKEAVFVDVAVINSIRNKKLDYKNIILDEIHHYLSDIARTVFTLNSFNIILGLTSTIIREDNRTFDDFYLKVVYNYTQEEAIRDKILCEYEIKNVAVNLIEDEKMWYDKYDVDIKDYFPIFGYDLKNVFSRGSGYSREKMLLRKAIIKRRMIVSNAINKVYKAAEIIRENKDEKIIVFCEYIKMANKIEEMLRKEDVISFGVYHSKLKDNIKKKILQDFQDNIIRLLISVKALDEGLNVPDCSIAVIIAGSKTARQMIQRTGRILRQKEGKKAVIYQVYVAGTQDFKYLKDRTKFLRGFSKQEFF